MNEAASPLALRDLTRLRAWARRRIIVEQPPERCACQWGCSACSRWLNANTTYRPPDPVAQRRRRIPVEQHERRTVRRAWAPAGDVLRALAGDDDTDLETFKALRVLIDAMPEPAR